MARAPFKLNCSGITLALVSAALASQPAAAAGRTEFTIGGVTLARDGVERPLTRGTELDNGDTVRTNDGRAQIRFTDGAYVSLQPNTEYSIRDYRYDKQGNERGFFGLLKGAMRTVTGAIGRINRDRYQIATPTATVGIRGTGGVIQVLDDGSTLVIGTSGIWSLTNPAGSVDVPAGTSAVAPSDPEQPPQETTQQPTSGPAPIPEEQPQFVAGEQVDEQGLPIIPQPTFTPLVSGSGYAAVVAWDAFRLDASPAGDAVFNTTGQMTSYSGSFGDYVLLTATHADFGTDGVLAWGRWANGTASVPCEGPCTTPYGANQGVHYVVGLPTPTLPSSGGGTYTVVGATQPTYADGTASPGTFSGTLTVNFGASAGMSAAFSIGIDGRSYVMNGSTTTATFFSMSTLSQNLSVSGCVSNCSGAIEGFFSGATADRAGVGYHINDGGDDILGAAAFQKTGELQPPSLIREPTLIQSGGL